MTKPIRVKPQAFQPGDQVAISVGALDGAVRWYSFDKVAQEYGEDGIVVEFLVGGGWPSIDFVLAKDELFEVRREIIAVA